MSKKSMRTPKISENRTAGGKPSPKKQFRSTTQPGHLLIVENDFGRSLQLRARLGMNRDGFARLVPMSTRNLANIESGKPPSPNLLRQLQSLHRVVDALSEVIQKDAVGPWLEQPNKAFDGLKPIEVIERGEVDRIWQMIFYLRSGVPS
jgi:hypothetical protein